MQGVVNQVQEWTFAASEAYDDPFNQVELDVVFADDGGTEWKVPAFWAGGTDWRVRFAPPAAGRYPWRSICSDTSDSGLHDVGGELEAVAYSGDNPLLKHGPIRVSESRRHFEHADGTPFFWLGDTWWMGLCKRWSWPADLQTMTADRVNKGFSVIQIIAGLYPDMPAFDERGANEAGFPWEADYARVNPAYFDAADRRIQHLVESGLAPCIVGCWGYYLGWLGIERMKKHWRNLVARWGAYPVVWCLAGEGSMPYYLSEQKDKDTEFQKDGWSELGRYVRELDPYHHPVTIHPSGSARNTVSDESVLDFDMLQTGHGDTASLSRTVELVTGGCAREPVMPVLNGEVCYEGIGDMCEKKVQRIMFWACMLSGACGHTYGANGIWQLNGDEVPYGPSPHGMAWGNTPWREAARFAGSIHVGLGKKLLERYEWWRFEPHPEWIAPRWSTDNHMRGYAAGVPDGVRVFYFPDFNWDTVTLKHLEQRAYRAFLFDPATGDETPLEHFEPDAKGSWVLQDRKGDALRLSFPLYQDWVLVVEPM